MTDTLYMAVTNDKYQLPIALENTKDELLRSLGYDQSCALANTVYHGLTRTKFIDFTILEVDLNKKYKKKKKYKKRKKIK